ncbi:uncharacterized protein LOC117576825 [Drosophila albomicans]|uniref:Uncharacterized protein LOC117576825 n=1 Tax=Drosophila albomicans TaxID=7291 RepID=A0A9C6TD81_DROAB|nr:uncharacterized protein LOC117576825 [Drosophila albomicans]
MTTTIGIWSVLAILVALTDGQIISSTSTTESQTETETTEYGPISMVVDQLAGMSVDFSDQSSAQLQANIDRALVALTGNIEAMSISAMHQMDQTIDQTSQFLMDHVDCNPAWNLQKFTSNVTRQLSDCSLNMGRLAESLRVDGQQVMADVQSFIQQMSQLPLMCSQQQQSASLAVGPFSVGFDNSNNCFMDGITSINQGLAKAMHNASLFLVHTRRLSQEQTAQSQQCSDAVVAQTLEYLNALRANCS